MLKYGKVVQQLDGDNVHELNRDLGFLADRDECETRRELPVSSTAAASSL